MISIDVIVPCYRYGHFLRECVESVLAQSGVDVRVLILDDASPDSTATVGARLALEDSRVTFRRHVNNKGHIATYNDGIAWARARYMLLLSADDYLLPGAMSRSLELMEQYPVIGFCFGDALAVSDHGETKPIRLTINERAEESSQILSGVEFIDLCRCQGARNVVPTPTAIVRTDLQKRLGGYLPELPHAGDFEMWLRLAAHSSVGYLRSDQAVYRRHSLNMSREYENKNVLRDLHQRKAALDVFLQTCAAQLPNIQQLHAGLVEALSLNAIGLASSAFNRDEIKPSQAISEFAASIYPGARRTLAWNRLALKRRLGRKLCSALLPAASMIRTVALRVRG